MSGAAAAAAAKTVAATAVKAASQSCYVALQMAPFPQRPKVLGIVPSNTNTDALYQANLREDGYLSKKDIKTIGLKAPSASPRVWMVPADIPPTRSVVDDKENIA
jgi:hypothetical protein